MVTYASASHNSSRSELDTTSESLYHLSERTSRTSGSELLPDISSAMDDTYDPPFLKDVRIQDRGWRNNVRHFVEKHHADGLTKATIRHWMAHFEFGSCLLDSSQLKSRYTALRELDEQMSTRFIQFYTTCYKPRGRHHQRTDEKTTEFSHCIDRQDSYSLHRMGPKQGAIFECRANADYPEQCMEKELLFCKVAHQQDGRIDPLWKNIVIDAGDEVIAHMSLFHPGCHYERLVGQVSDVLAEWVFDSMA
jgi:hypothetical protein